MSDEARVKSVSPGSRTAELDKGSWEISQPMVRTYLNYRMGRFGSHVGAGSMFLTRALHGPATFHCCSLHARPRLWPGFHSRPKRYACRIGSRCMNQGCVFLHLLVSVVPIFPGRMPAPGCLLQGHGEPAFPSDLYVRFDYQCPQVASGVGCTGRS